MKIIIINYEDPDVSPEIIMATDENEFIDYQKYKDSKSLLPLRAYLLIIEAWENGAWRFADKQYGLIELDWENLEDFIDEIKGALNETKNT